MRRAVALATLVAALAAPLSACSRAATTVTATFDDAGDLQSRGAVQVADVRVGTIGSIKLTEDFRARVTLHLRPGVRVPRASEALLRQTSLLGERFVELRPLGSPTAAPFFRDGDVVRMTGEAPELEFVAEQAVDVLGAVTAGDISDLIATGAQGFGGHREDLRSVIDGLSSFSAALASRTKEITAIVDGLDRATTTLAGGADDITTLLTNLAGTTQILADNRDRTIAALDQLSRLAHVENTVLDRYTADIDRQIKQADAILAAAAGSQAEVANLVDWLARFVPALPRTVPGDFTQVYMWLIPAQQDPRVGK